MLDRHQHSPWDFWATASDDARTAQRELQDELRAGHPSWRFGEACFVADSSAVDADELDLGDRSYIAAGAYLTGTVRIGADCSINPYTVVRGDVILGDGVRMGAHSSVLGFNHSMLPGTPVFRQPLTSRGVRIGDDVWIGSHVVVLDGVTVGDHAVLAAGAVVVKDVPSGAIVGGNPARLLRWRVEPGDLARQSEPSEPGEPGGPGGPSEPSEPSELDGPARCEQARSEQARGEQARGGIARGLADFAAAARHDAPALLARARDGATGLFADRPGAPVTVRAQGDAVEIADLLLSSPPPGTDPAALIGLLQGWQDAATGAVPARGAAATTDWRDGDTAYHVLSIGYALDLLGAGFRHPLGLIRDATAESIVARLESLPWNTDPWNAGHHVDAIGTALLWARRRGDDVPPGVAEALFGWLALNVDARTGMWGSPSPERGLLLVVNGFYRASRGTLAQHGVTVPHPEAVIDTVLRHVRDDRWFAPSRRDACNVLDVAHPLWLTRGSEYRGDEVRAVARDLLDHALTGWHAGEGMSFTLSSDEPGLQGTEMWLAIVWYLADLLGESAALGYRPRGVHRPEPAPR